MGASGSGTTTLGRALAAHWGAVHLDADDYYWLPTSPPYRHKRPAAERLARLQGAMTSAARVVVSGSVMGWGDEVEEAFDFVVFLYLDAAQRIERLRIREKDRFGAADPAFLTWAAQYDAGPPEGRSLARHRHWLATRRCPVLHLGGELSTAEQLARIDAVVRGAAGHIL
jgi:uridine kinase